MAVRRIKSYKRNTFADTLGAIGQGLNGFAGSYMGKKQFDMAKEQNETQKAMQSKMMQLMESMYPQAGAAGQAPGQPSNMGQIPAPTMAPFQASAAGGGIPGQDMNLSPEMLAKVQRLASGYKWGV